MMEHHELLVVGRDGVICGVLSVSVDPASELALVVGDDTYSSTGYDLFDALTALRRSLESDGLLLCCAGARGDVHPSGMSRQMSGGRAAYRHVAGRPPGSADLVDIFEAADPAEVTSVDAQLDSVRKLRGGG